MFSAYNRVMQNVWWIKQNRCFASRGILDLLPTRVTCCSKPVRKKMIAYFLLTYKPRKKSKTLHDLSVAFIFMHNFKFLFQRYVSLNLFVYYSWTIPICSLGILAAEKSTLYSLLPLLKMLKVSFGKLDLTEKLQLFKALIELPLKTLNAMFCVVWK